MRFVFVLKFRYQHTDFVLPNVSKITSTVQRAAFHIPEKQSKRMTTKKRKKIEKKVYIWVTSTIFYVNLFS